MDTSIETDSASKHASNIIGNQYQKLLPLVPWNKKYPCALPTPKLQSTVAAVSSASSGSHTDTLTNSSSSYQSSMKFPLAEPVTNASTGAMTYSTDSITEPSSKATSIGESDIDLEAGSILTSISSSHTELSEDSEWNDCEFSKKAHNLP